MNLDRRQKILIPLIVIAFIYIGWQVYNIFFAGKSIPASLPSKQINLSAPPVAQQPPPSEEIQAGETMPAPISAPSVIPKPQKQIGPEKKLISDISVQSDAYLKLMKEYQTLEAERMLLEEKVAIAEMKQKISELNAKLSQLPGVETEVAKKVKGPEYKLIYLDRQQGEWTATLADRNNTFQEVVPGAKLANGYKVIAITSKGVVIRQNSGEVMQITFSGIISMKVTPQPKYQVKIVPPKAKPAMKTTKRHVVKPKTKKLVAKAVKSAEVVELTMPKTKPAPNYSLQPARASSQKPSVPAPKTKPVAPNYILRKAEQQGQPHPQVVPRKSAEVVELTLPKQRKAVKARVLPKPVDLNYYEPPKPRKITAAKKSPAVVTELLPQENNSEPIILMN